MLACHKVTSPRSSAYIAPRSPRWNPATARVSAVELAQLAQIYDVNVAWLLGEAPETLDAQDPRLELAARELAKLQPDDLERLLKLLAAMRSESNATGSDP